MKHKRWITCISALVAFIIIAYFVSTGRQLAFDTVIREWFYSLRTGWLDPVIIFLTYIGNTKTIVIICILLLILPQTRFRYGIPVSAAAIVASSLNTFLKTIFQRPRPDISLHIIEQGGWSFPSGHSITSLVVFGLLIWLVRYYMLTPLVAKTTDQIPLADDTSQNKEFNIRRRRLANIVTVLLLIPCFGIGLSRIYVGVHFPTDVLGGWCLGMIILIITITIMEAIKKPLVR